MDKNEIKTGDTFDVESIVPKNGFYVCVPCGEKKEFKTGETFPSCFSCLDGKKYKGEQYVIGLGLWELLGDN